MFDWQKYLNTFFQLGPLLEVLIISNHDMPHTGTELALDPTPDSSEEECSLVSVLTPLNIQHSGD